MLKIRELREDNDYKQSFIAEYLNMSQTNYSKIELGRLCLSINDLIKLSKLYKVSTDYILGLTKNKRIN